MTKQLKNVKLKSVSLVKEHEGVGRIEKQPWVIVFGSERIASLYGAREGIHRSRLILATRGGAAVQGLLGPITVLRVSKDRWVAPTFACEKRCAEVEKALSHLGRMDNVRIDEVFLE